MSATNGAATRRILKIEDEGRCVVAFKDGTEVELDVIAVHNAYIDMSRPFYAGTNELPPEKLAEFNNACWDFVRNVIRAAVQMTPDAARKAKAEACANNLSLQGALTFLARITEEGLRLRPFFRVRSPAEPSSPAPTELTFSTET